MWRWETLLERGEPAVPVFAARSGNVVLVATKLELVRDAMSSITRGVDVTGARSLTACLKGYPRLWGARLYGTRRYRDKLSSGLRLDGYEVEQDAKYTLFELGSGTSLSIRYCCSSGNAGPLRYFGQSGKSVKEIQPGIWETNLELGDPQSDEGFVLCVLGLFGFGIYV